MSDKQGFLAAPRNTAVQLSGGYMGDVQRMVREKMLPFQWEALHDRIEGAEPSHCIRNFRAAAGEINAPHGGFCFQDSDLAKWLEAAAYALELKRDPALEAQCDEAIDLIARAQAEDGYLDTYYQLVDLSQRFTNLRDDHELYIAGHMLEAAVAYARATGKDKLLTVMKRMLACIDAYIGPEEGKLHGYPGHEEIELALCRLYEMTDDTGALRMAKYFIDERGASPAFFVEEAEKRTTKTWPTNLAYHQAQAPVREQETMEGHSVRALYLLSGMLDVARHTQDEGLLDASKRLFDNVVNKRMYVTGGVGSTHHGEAFSFDYDLPPDTAYAETCAAIALFFAAARLSQIEPSGRYADIMERTLYNGCMAGMSLDGSRFFYVNPLEVDPQASKLDPEKRHVLPERPPWFGCACCPPNLARLLLSLGTYQYGIRGQDVYVQLYFQGQATLPVNGQDVRLSIMTEYPRDGRIRIHAGQGTYRLHLRIPAWCEGYTVLRGGEATNVPVKDGYITLEGPFDGETITLELSMTPQRNYAHPKVRAVAGCTAITYGPLVYCLEGIDNGDQLQTLLLPDTAALSAHAEADLLGGVVVVTAPGLRETADTEALYRRTPPTTEPVALTFVPYAAWANRGENEMRVWVRTKA